MTIEMNAASQKAPVFMIESASRDAAAYTRERRGTVTAMSATIATPPRQSRIPSPPGSDHHEHQNRERHRATRQPFRIWRRQVIERT